MKNVTRLSSWGKEECSDADFKGCVDKCFTKTLIILQELKNESDVASIETADLGIICTDATVVKILSN